MKAIFGNKLAPTLADHILARNGYKFQQYDGPEDPNRPDNLYQPVAGDHGAHGSFDNRSKTQSWEFWAESHTGLLASVLGISIAGLLWKLSR